MKSVIFAVFLFVAVSLARVEVQIVDSSRSVESQYIIVFHENTTDAQIANHVKDLYRSFSTDGDFANAISATYNFGDFHGFSARLSPRLLSIQQESSLISFIEQDAYVQASQSCSQQSNAVWGLDRISSQQINLDGIYQYGSTSGAGVDAYIVDTGINIKHIDFGGRAIWGANYADTTNTDCNGHGTHVAGTVGSTTYGVAKKSTLIAVKVLDCNGSGTNTGVISGVQWVVTSKNSRKNPSVANMSLGGGKSTALDTAVSTAVKAGVTFVVAAGNENDDACLGSPSNVPVAITVGATGVDEDINTEVDSRAYFSNYGKCTTVFAPGLMIESTWIGSKNNEVNTISGTSMASPHVAGIVAMYLGANGNVAPATVKTWLLQNASNGLIQLDCSGATSTSICNLSPNRLAYSPCNSA